MAGFDNSRISFDADHLYLNVANLFVESGGTLAISFTPEPSSVVMLALGGIGLLGFASRRAWKRDRGGDVSQ